MSDSTARHLIAFIGTIIVLLAYIAGYMSSTNGWWWTAISVVVIYVSIFKLVDL